MMTWGLLGPEVLTSQRRIRTLELGAAVRALNDKAVPGMGGVWYGKQLLLATLGVAVAEAARRNGRSLSNIHVTNAIEALACWCGFQGNGWRRDARLLGSTKLSSDLALDFGSVSKPSFYVSQPMRMATVQPLPTLGLVEARTRRFNAFKSTEAGREFINVATESYQPYGSNVLNGLVKWVCGSSKNIDTWHMRQALSPLVALQPKACELLHNRLVQGEGEGPRRRGAVLEWMERLRGAGNRADTWENKPGMFDEQHWRDLHVGGLFFQARNAAIALLDQIEVDIGRRSDQRMELNAALPEQVSESIGVLRTRAQNFLAASHDPTHGQEATRFCRECVESSNVAVIRHLLAREGRILRLRGNMVVPGAAFRGASAITQESDVISDDEGDESRNDRDIILPDGISYRVYNLFWLNLDLHGDLNRWMERDAA